MKTTEARTRRLTIATGLSTLLLVLAGCGGDESQSAAEPAATVTVTADAESEAADPSPSPSEIDEAWQTATEYVRAIAALDYGKAKHLAAPGSPAQKYAIHQEAVDQAYVAAYGSGNEPTSAVPDEERGSVTLAYPEGGAVFSDFEADQSDRLIDFSTHGKPVSGRLWSRPASVSVGGVRFQMVSAFESTGGLFVALRMKSTSQAVQMDFAPTYSGPTGSQSSAAEAVTPEQLQANSTSLIAYVFPRAKLGGTLAWQFWVDPDGASTNYRSSLPVR